MSRVREILMNKITFNNSPRKLKNIPSFDSVYGYFKSEYSILFTYTNIAAGS